MKGMNMFEKTKKVSEKNALKGRAEALKIISSHSVLGSVITPPFAEGLELAEFGLGCFWGAERKFWQLEGVVSTAVGYSSGYTPNPTYEEVCSGSTGHNEVVRVVFDPRVIAYASLLAVFWESHNPTQGMQQGGDIGTQYRSGIYTHSEHQQTLAMASLELFQDALKESGVSGIGSITTEIQLAQPFYYAEEYHQQYLAKNPGGYCGLGGLGITYPL